MTLAGLLYRHTPRLFHKHKPGNWTLVWCELFLPSGEIVFFQEKGGRRISVIPICSSEFAHVRCEGRDCIEIQIQRTKKDILSSHESSYDVDFWSQLFMHLLLLLFQEL